MTRLARNVRRWIIPQSDGREAIAPQEPPPARGLPQGRCASRAEYSGVPHAAAVPTRRHDSLATGLCVLLQTARTLGWTMKG